MKKRMGMVACVWALAACSPAAEAPKSPTAEAAAPAAQQAEPAAPAKPKLTVADLAAPWSSADPVAGKGVFVQCSACHALDPAMGNMVGPNLHGVFQRAPGAVSGFRYSEALTAHVAKVPQWTPEELDKWLGDPVGYVPGTAMYFNGISDPAMRQNLIAYLLIETTP